MKNVYSLCTFLLLLCTLILPKAHAQTNFWQQTNGPYGVARQLATYLATPIFIVDPEGSLSEAIFHCRSRY